MGVGRPLVYADYTQGILWPGAERFVVDTLARGALAADCDGSIPASTMGSDVTFSPIGVGNAGVCQGPADDIAPVPGPTVGSDHETEALQVEWGGPNAGVQVEWSLVSAGMPLDEVGNYTHLSFRVGNPITSCPPSIDEFQLEVQLVAQGQDGLPVVRTVLTDVLPDQHGESVQSAQGLPLCASSHFMHTLRIPLTDFCEQGIGFDPSALTAVHVRFPDSDELHEAIVDSIEFTRDPSDTNTTACAQSKTDWNCIATEELVAIETSCSGEPRPTCSSSNTVTNPVGLPWVSNGVGGGYGGWVAHVPSGWIADPTNPTQTELDGVLEACIAACKLEWSDNPDVEADCSAAGAFSTPTLRANPGLGPIHRIPPAEENGSGLFATESLSCSLEGDCCHAFDEDLCAARPTRTTAARQPLDRGEEVRVNIGTTASKATFITPGDVASLPLTGTAGYSLCTNPAGTCPFYLGSLAVTATGSATIEDTCADQSSFSAEVADFDIELLQPAFGIDSAGVFQQAFPRGALHLQGFITVNGVSYTVRAVNEDAVFLTASHSGFFAGELDIELTVPCGSTTLPVMLRIELRHSGTPTGRPPSINITSPATVACPGALALTQTSSDPDADLASIRWYVDDVLMAPGVSTITFNQAHRWRAVARDARGAATTDVQTVSCQ